MRAERIRLTLLYPAADVTQWCRHRGHEPEGGRGGKFKFEKEGIPFQLCSHKSSTEFTVYKIRNYAADFWQFSAREARNGES
jgi:hypothetical protein